MTEETGMTPLEKAVADNFTAVVWAGVVVVAVICLAFYCLASMLHGMCPVCRHRMECSECTDNMEKTRERIRKANMEDTERQVKLIEARKGTNACPAYKYDEGTGSLLPPPLYGQPTAPTTCDFSQQ